MARDDFQETDKLVYDCALFKANTHIYGLKLEYDTVKNLLRAETTRTLPLFPEYLKAHCKNLSPLSFKNLK